MLNETQHPKAVGLFASLAEGVDNYEGVEVWRSMQGYSDEKAADLYARIEDAFDGSFGTITKPVAVTMLSKALWANDKALVQ